MPQSTLLSTHGAAAYCRHGDRGGSHQAGKDAHRREVPERPRAEEQSELARPLGLRRVGGTVEAAGVGLGVRRDKVQGRLWHLYAMVPGVSYAATSATVEPEPLPFLLTLTQPPTSGPGGRRHCRSAHREEARREMAAQGYAQ